jgi:putative membrane protein
MTRGTSRLGAVAIGAGCALIGYGAALEWRAYQSLASTERLRAILASNAFPVDTVRAASIAWANMIAASAVVELGTLERGLQAAETVAELRALLRARLLDRLREASVQIGQRAAIDAATLVAICPHPALDGLMISARSLVMIRQIASVYGVRPGLAVTVALMRRAAFTSAATSAIDFASQELAGHLLSSTPVVKHIAAAIPGASTAALRIYRLAKVTADACCPIQT